MKRGERGGERGAAVVEFAILTLLLLIFVFGIIEIGYLWAQKHYIGHAVREGGRTAARVAIYNNNTNAIQNLNDVKQAVEDAIEARLEEAPFYVGKLDQLVDIPDPVLVLAGTAQIPSVRVSVVVDTLDPFGNGSILWELLKLFPAANPDQAQPLTLTSSAVFAIEKR